MQDLSTISNQLSRHDLFVAFKIQLAKDFEQSNFSSDFIESLDPNYDSILKQISGVLQHHEKKADSSLMNLLYRIDISEMQLKVYLNEQSNENQLNVIAELIIKRVLQKVVIKQFYKNKENL